MLLGYSSARYKGESFTLGSLATPASTLLIGLSQMCKVHPRLLPACLLGTASSSCRCCILSSLWVPRLPDSFLLCVTTSLCLKCCCNFSPLSKHGFSGILLPAVPNEGISE